MTWWESSHGGKPVSGAFKILKRGLADSKEMRQGLGYTIGLAMAYSLGSLMVPILIQQILDKGLVHGFRPHFVYTWCALAAVGVVIVYIAGRATFRRMVAKSELALKSLRTRVFGHIHRLSIAEHSSTRRGTYVTRVTSDIDQLLQFMEWGALSWILGGTLMIGTLIAMFAYSWRLTLVVVFMILPVVFIMRWLQRGLLAAYEEVRTRVGNTLSEISESVMGAAVIRAYGYDERMDQRLKGAINAQYKSIINANKYQATTLPMSDFFGGVAMAAVLFVGVTYGPGWGMSAGEVVAFMFLVSLFLQPVGEMAETFDQTQTAIAAWRKVLGVLDIPIDVVEPDPGVQLPDGPLAVTSEGLKFSYREGGLVLKGIDVDVYAGGRVAIVGETGCGKTTFAKLLCRLADPDEGRIVIGGVDLREVATESRRKAIRMVPQDGFLFDTSIRENVRYGRDGATDADVEASFEALGLTGWVQRRPNGLDTQVGERGESLSVGERQLVALVRAQIADPGLLILDEATSAVDPETEAALTQALERLSEGRTTLAIAHRLSTAERADYVLVFDRGEIVERGNHRELVAAGGVYASLYRSWLGNTQST
ncbi:MAG: ATP-binding cassette, subfamily bacterial [Actinomycetota bacterium]|jgi:putative ABC transport system ATP-binding protein|nr:ATP-binding cassette, subfamily bacterial [Actinomycetota bacterium]